MKSIYEASVAYGREHQGTVNIEDYQAGANAVLEEIEHWMNTRYSFSFVEFKNFVKQLKG